MSCFCGVKSWITESAGPLGGKDVLLMDEQIFGDAQPEQPEQPEPEPFKSPQVRKSEIWEVLGVSYLSYIVIRFHGCR